MTSWMLAGALIGILLRPVMVSIAAWLRGSGDWPTPT